MPAAGLAAGTASVLVRDVGGNAITPSPAVPARRDRRRPTTLLRSTDALLPVALVLWAAGVHAIDPAAMNDYGLLPALPIVYFVALGLLVGSIAATLLRNELSPVRLGLHLVGLVVVLHGTIPLIFAEPNFPWVYKHMGVVGYINLHGLLRSNVDIYQNWPGFFALAAWFTKMAGVGSPLSFAAWAPLYFNLLICLELGFVFRSLPVTRRVRWLALFLFVAGNWVGQDYFAPQAMAFVLSLAVFGMILTWFQVDRPPALVRALRRLASHAASRRAKPGQEAAGPPAAKAPPRVWAVAALFVTFAVLVVTHQLSPYVVILGIGLLTVAGMIRPRWLVVGLVAVTIGYLLLRLPFIQRTQDLFGSLGDPLDNVHNSQPNDSVAMKGRRLTALAAPALIAGMWLLGIVGVVRRIRARRTALVLALLAFSPALVALGQNYGGEAVFRIYLFSLPWTAVLAASALDPHPRRGPLWSATKVAVVLSVALVLFMSAFFGSEELYEVRPGEVAASQYFYDHAEPGSVLTLVAPNFPTRISARYDQFRSVGDNPPNLLTTANHFRHRMLGDELPAVSEFIERYAVGGAGGRYLVLSTGQQVYATVLGLLPPGSLGSLDRALAESPNWSVYHRNPDAVIYRSLSAPGDEHGAGAGIPALPASAPTPTVRPAASDDRSRDWAALGIAVLGFSLIGLAVRRRRAIASAHVERVFNKEEIVGTSLTANGSTPEASSEVTPEDEPLIVTAPAARIEDLLSQAVAVPPYARGPYCDALAKVEPERARFRELVSGVEPAQRPAAVEVLGAAWGPLSSAQLRPVLDDPSASVRAAALAVLDVSQEAVGELHRALRDDLCSQVRAAALAALAKASEDEQLAALSVALADPQPAVRACALAVLPVASSGRATTSVLAAIQDGHEQVREAACRRLDAATPWILWMALETCPDRTAVAAALRQRDSGYRLGRHAQERMSSPEPRDRVLALEVLGLLGTPGSVNESINALGDPVAAVRVAAVAQLRERPEASTALVAVLQDDPDPEVRRAAASALESVEADQVHLAFTGAIQDPDVEVRRRASDAVVRWRSRGLADRLATVLTMTNRSSVGAALLRMGDVGEDALVSAAIEGPRDRALAATELLRMTGKLESLMLSLRAVNPSTRLRAVEAVGTLGGPEALDGLVAALSDPSPEIRSRAAFHLGRMGDERGRASLQQTSGSDQAAEVLRAGLEALHLMDEGARQNGARADGKLAAENGGWG